MQLQQSKVSKLSNFHIMFFAVTMGLGGLSISYRGVNEAFGLSNLVF